MQIETIIIARIPRCNSLNDSVVVINIYYATSPFAIGLVIHTRGLGGNKFFIDKSSLGFYETYSQSRSTAFWRNFLANFSD